MSNNTENKYTPNEAAEIFARQKERFALTEEEKAHIKKLGLDDIDLSNLDFFDERSPLDIVDGMSLAECENLGDDTDYSDIVEDSDFTVSEIVAHCLNELYRHIETGSIDEKMMDINEKLLCFAEGDDLVNAITCMGLQLAVYNRTKGEANYTNRPGNSGEMLNFYHNMAELVSDWRLLDADAQTTLAHEAHLVENDMYEAEAMAYNFYGILKRVESADSYLPQEGEHIYKPGLTEISADVVKMHYKDLFAGYESSYNKMSSFISKLLDDDITLNEKGRYDRNKSVIVMAKMAAFGDADYELDGDEHRVYEYIEKPASKPVEKEPENKSDAVPVQKTTFSKGNKKQTKAQKLAEKRAAKYEKNETETVKEAIDNTVPDTVSETEEKIITKDADARATYDTFFSNKEYNKSDYKRECMAYTCFEYLSQTEYGNDTCIDYTEKLMELDKNNEHSYRLSKNEKMYEGANRRGYFYGSLNKKLEEAKQYKAKATKASGIMDTPLLPKLGLLAAVAVFIVALFIPIGIFQSIFTGLLKIIYVLIGLFFFFTTGFGVVLMLPIFVVVINTIINMVGTFIHPAWILKLLVLAIPGFIAATLFEEVRHDLRRGKFEESVVSSIKKRWLPQSEKFLTICKERHMPQEMITYYERLVEEFKKL